MLSRFDPLQEMTTLRRAMDDLLERSFVRSGFVGGMQAGPVPMDIQENDQGYKVRVAVPGFKPDDLDIVVQQNMVMIRGHMRQETPEEQAQGTWVRREIRSEAFERSVTFDRPIDPDKISTSYEHGVLTLNVPAHEAARPRHISISGEGQKAMGQGQQQESQQS